MASVSEVQADKLAAEMALASILGASRGTAYRGRDSSEGRAYDRLCDKIEKEVLAVLPYLANVD